jgi:hypothetical protein
MKTIEIGTYEMNRLLNPVEGGGTLAHEAGNIETSKSQLPGGEDSPFRMATGVVLEASGQCYTVIDSAPRICQLAASCLTQPEAGDKVLLADCYGELWILAVLVAAAPRSLHLGGREIKCTAERIDLRAQMLNTESREWQASHGSVQFYGAAVRACCSSVEWVGRKMSVLADICFSRFRRNLREVSEIETLRCGTCDIQADDVLALSGQTSLLTAQGMAKVDAAQIHIG